MNLHAMIEARASLWAQIKAHLDTVAAEGRAATGEAEATYNRMHADMAELDARIAEAVELDKRNAQAADIAARYAVKPEAPKAEASDADLLKRMVAGEIRGHEFRDLSKLSAGAGANTVPTSFYGRLVEHMIVNAGLLRTNVSTLDTATGETIQIPKTTAHSSAAWIAEAGSVTESDPAFGQVSLGAYKVGLAIDVSHELEKDTGVDLLGYLARQGGRALGNTAGAAYITGDGSSKPTGIVGASTLGVTGAAAVAGTMTGDNLIDLFYSVIEPYRVNGYWLMNDSTLAVVRKLKDSANRYLFEVEGGMAGAPGVGTILGRPVVTDPTMAAVAADAKSILFGDMSAYYVRRVSGIRVERSEHAKFENDLVTWRFLMRTDGKLVDTTGAVKHFVGGAAS